MVYGLLRTDARNLSADPSYTEMHANTHCSLQKARLWV